MGAFRYCDCGCPLSEPTPEEDLLIGQVCPNCEDAQKGFYSMQEWIVKLSERIAGLEKK